MNSHAGTLCECTPAPVAWMYRNAAFENPPILFSEGPVRPDSRASWTPLIDWPTVAGIVKELRDAEDFIRNLEAENAELRGLLAGLEK